MRRVLGVAMLGTAIASAIAGAVLSALPALVLAVVTLFYNSAGGVLILLGSLISLLPHPAIPAGTAGGLPVFQILQAHTGVVLMRSAAATTLCSVAVVALATPRQSHCRKRWGFCASSCLLAALLGGHDAALALAPSIVVSGGNLALSWSGHIVNE